MILYSKLFLSDPRCLFIGILFGIRSSVLVASLLVMWLGVSREGPLVPKKEAAADSQP